ncbi:hypothetical protein ACG7TL_006151 [Trametes sanguinea]
MRSAPGQRNFRHALGNQVAETSAHGANSTGGIYLQWHYENIPGGNFQDPVGSFDSSQAGSYQEHPQTLQALESGEEQDPGRELTPEPSVQFTRETWWDSLLMMYASEDIGQELQVISLTADQRFMYTQRIFVDIRALLHTSVYWASFLHIPRFFETLIDSVRRSSIQPSLILAMLAMGTFVQSSNLRLGARGRKRALKLIEQAHAALQASLSSRWVDIGLAQAAWFLAYFEIQVHPEQSWERNRSSFVLLDSLIRLLSLTTLDADVPHARFTLFAMHKGPASSFPHVFPLATPGLPGHDNAVLPVEVACSCAQYTLRKQWPGVLELAPLWDATAMWPSELSEGELRKEEGRRLVWSSVMLAAGHNSYTSARADVEKAELYIKRYENYALLLPGESLSRSGTPVSRNNIWSLYLRAMLLWHTGIRTKSDRMIPDHQKSQYAIDAWLETEAIEVALNQHVCDLESRMGHQAREFLFKNNSLLRQKTESWLRRQMAVTQYLWDCLHTNPANELGTRSFLVYWFMGHVLRRALVIWENDPTMTLALDAAKLFVLPLEYLMQLWPSQSKDAAAQSRTIGEAQTYLERRRYHPKPFEQYRQYELFEAAYDESSSDNDPFTVDFDELLNLHNLNVGNQASDEASQSIPARPSLQFTRDTWWDALLTFYSCEGDMQALSPITLSAEQRSGAMVKIVSDLRSFFFSSFYWLSFINIPRFFDDVFDTTRRAQLQPSLLLSALAVGTLAQSSDADNGAPGRARALRLLELADGALQASLAAGWVDIGLVKAAWLIVYFEMQVHPLKSVERDRSSLLLLDSLIRLFSLTTLDLDLQRAQPTVPIVNASATSYYPTALGSSDSQSFNPYRYSGTGDSSAFGITPTPMVDTNASSTLLHTPSTVPHIPDNLTIGPSTSPLVSHCNCTELAITQDWPTVQEVAPSWGGTIKWPKGMSEAELRKEECRRLVWATVTLTATLNTYTSVIGDDGVTPLSIKNPRNYALMFPAESLAMTGTPVQANNMWTLYLRSMLLLQSCEQVRTDRNMCDADRAQFAMNAWLEIDAVESALDQHTCGLEAKSGFHAREMLFSARMCVSHEFQRYIPQVSTIGGKIFYRDQAERWLKQRMALADLIWASLKEGRYVQTLDRRKPLLIYWFVSHIIKALMLWRVDHTFTIALIASKAFVKCAEYLMVFWPSSEQRREWQKIRFELVEACLQAGVPPPETSIPIPFPRKEGAAAV